MSISSALRSENQRGKINLIPFLTAGYPSIEENIEILQAIISQGLVSTIEVGIPFSDPIAEGRTIQKSSSIALKNGVDIEKTFKIVEKATKYNNYQTPIVSMGYYNPILKFGIENFCKSANQIGIKGLIIADIPNDELSKIQSIANRNNIDTIPLIPLNSSNERLVNACKIGQGFIYCVSVLGVTGSRENLSKRVQKIVKKVKTYTNLPVAVGFGISKPSHIKQISQFADAAVIGSALIDIISDSNKNDLIESVIAFISKLKKSSNI